MFSDVVVVVQAGANAAVVFPVVVVATGFALAAAIHAADASPCAEGLEAALAGDHAGAHGGVYALGALPAPRLCPIEGLEVCFVLGGDGAAVLQGGHLLARLVDIGVVVLGLLSLDDLGVVVGAAGEGAT